MKIVRDDAQQRLVLEAPVVAAPRAVTGCLATLLIGLFVGVPAVELAGALLRGARPAELVLSLLLLLVGGVVAALALRGLRGVSRYVRRVRVDRAAGELAIDEQSPLGGARGLVVGLDRLERIVAGVERMKPSVAQTQPGVDGMSGQPRLGLRLQVEWRDARGRSERRRFGFVVDQVDERKELVDLAYRLGRAAGLVYTRVMRNDPAGMEVELSREAGPGREPLPLLGASADYARDEVSPQAARVAAQERVAPFVPSEFRGDLRCTAWQRGQLISFRRGPGVALVCLPFTLLLLTGPAFYALGPIGGAEHLPVSILLGMLGLFLGAFAITTIAGSLPRSIRFDWASGRLQRRGVVAGYSLPLAEIREVELRCVAQRYSGTSRRLAYVKHRCEVVAHLRPREGEGPASETIVATEPFREDKDTPYRMALPLATELAQALGVPCRVTGFG